MQNFPPLPKPKMPKQLQETVEPSFFTKEFLDAAMKPCGLVRPPLSFWEKWKREPIRLIDCYFLVAVPYMIMLAMHLINHYFLR